ncbi:hypothetical protein [Methanocorpusculum vombati]|uniref:DUF4013 domain-containing protein n=1 Tax=Methanocorpusculum vombati TaxID=3002864 RepID=A0ABT4INW5_9EURY|nr:hypothetical protein [Methanocorpusculum vombati]MCZ9318995.1 hypothetical protein [Methanocorpusculum sp.]MCZ0863251.1 hypothetical protein [Methanocorpusculum vombati]MDE2519796.1 hypothetical protein [Methanocorpusculum sp.]MDE2534686.1 hypothetical protein [Methanocorpusculum sp.]MDE2546312.1 hypothetical protein [Methanocorpusculum sp.]
MALQSLGEAAGWMVKSPYVWLSGLWTAAVLLLFWYLYANVGVMTAVSVAMVLAFMLPALIAGTYGIVAEHESSFAVFRRYAVHGYFRQLLPSLLVFLIAWVISQFISYLLMTFGFGLTASAQVAMFVFIPVVFFCYFADVTAVVNEKRVFASVKDSFLRVMNGSFSVAIFYLVNVALLIAASFIGSFVFAALATDAFLPLASMTEAELLSLTPDELLAIMSAPEVVFAGFTTLAVCAVIFVPLFTLYKACYFAKTSALVLPDVPAAEPEGEYDEKGRWYKYK